MKIKWTRRSIYIDLTLRKKQIRQSPWLHGSGSAHGGMVVLVDWGYTRHLGWRWCGSMVLMPTPLQVLLFKVVVVRRCDSWRQGDRITIGYWRGRFLGGWASLWVWVLVMGGVCWCWRCSGYIGWVCGGLLSLLLNPFFCSLRRTLQYQFCDML